MLGMLSVWNRHVLEQEARRLRRGGHGLVVFAKGQQRLYPQLSIYKSPAALNQPESSC